MPTASSARSDGHKTHVEKFQELLRELFQFDCADLDFGIYRIMNHKRDVVKRFIAEELPETIDDELSRGLLARQAADKAKLDAAREKVLKGLGPDAIAPDGEIANAALAGTPVAREYLDAKARAGASRSRAAVEADVYNHLTAFFSRYYEDGDFVSKRRYSRKHRYAIPYNGEEVYLHWANADQYYVKTAEHFHGYGWKAPNGVSVRFLVKEANVEQNNVKGERRFFLPNLTDAEWDESTRTVTLPFAYRPLNGQEKRRYSGNKQQEKIIAATVEALTERPGERLGADALAALGRERRRNAKDEPVSDLEHHLRRYTRRNDSDFFIHKDLRGFLTRELDFYLKNEVLNLDDLAAAGEFVGEGWFQLMELMRSVGGQIIDFLAQIEGFQKMLWEKRKFVTETNYCVAMRCVPPEFRAEIAGNEAQWAEWRALGIVGGEPETLFDSCRTHDERVAFLEQNPTLMLDTVNFSADFTDRLVAEYDDLDDVTDAVLFNSENWQALRLMRQRYGEEVKCIYIDPPYNTGQLDEFLYKDNYKHSSWMAMMMDRALACRPLAAKESGIFVSTDDGEYANLRGLLSHAWGATNFVADVIWNSRKSVSSDTLISTATNHTTFFAANKAALDANKSRFRLPQDAGKFTNPDSDPLGPWTLDPMDAPNVRENLTYVISNPETGKEFLPPPGRCWRFEREETERLLAEGRILFGRSGKGRPQYKRYLSEAAARGKAPTTLWDDVKTTTDATRTLLALFGESLDRSVIDGIKPKPTELVGRCTRLLVSQAEGAGVVLDYFAGSGTTGHAVINLNREDAGRRKFVLVEMGEYFDGVALPRLKKVVFSPEWRGGRPEGCATPEEAERSPRLVKYMRLESYEDALDSISLDEAAGQLELEDRLQGYLLNYMLRWETKDSATLLNPAELASPFSYRLRVHENGDVRERPVDVAETFNYLLGLHVRTRRVYAEGGRRYLAFRGETRDAPDRTTVVIWRDTEGWREEELAADRDFVGAQGMTDGADTVYVNGMSSIPGARPVEPLFKARMFAGVSDA